MEMELGDFRENLRKGLLLYDDLGNFKSDFIFGSFVSREEPYVPKKTFIRHSALISIYTCDWIAENPDCLGAVSYSSTFIIGKKPNNFMLRLLFGEIIRVDHVDKQGNKIELTSPYSLDDMIEKGITAVWIIDEEKLKKELDSIIYLSETADIYDALVSSCIFKSRTDAKNNWTFSGKEIECGITELLYVGKYKNNFFIYKDYPDEEEVI